MAVSTRDPAAAVTAPISQSGARSAAGRRDRGIGIAGPRARRRHGADGDRSRARVFRAARGRPDGRHLLHALGHALRRAGLRVPRRHRGVPARTRLANRGALARFLVVRGLWLVLLELTVIRVAWTFNLDFANYMLAGVIWMIGWCMVLLAAIVPAAADRSARSASRSSSLHNLTDVFGARAGVR